MAVTLVVCPCRLLVRLIRGRISLGGCLGVAHLTREGVEQQRDVCHGILLSKLSLGLRHAIPSLVGHRGPRGPWRLFALQRQVRAVEVLGLSSAALLHRFVSAVLSALVPLRGVEHVPGATSRLGLRGMEEALGRRGLVVQAAAQADPHVQWLKEVLRARFALYTDRRDCLQLRLLENLVLLLLLLLDQGLLVLERKRSLYGQALLLGLSELLRLERGVHCLGRWLQKARR